MSRRFAMTRLPVRALVLAAGLLATLGLTPATVLAAPAPAAQAVSSVAAGKAVILEGVLQVEVADYPDHTSSTQHFLKTAAGERHRLNFRNAPAGFALVSGTKLRIKGQLADNVLTAESDPAAVQELAAAMPYAVGVQKTAVILVNFQDKASVPQTPTAVHQLVFGQVNNFLLENSFQTTSLSGNVFGWYTIPVSSTSCNIGAIKTAAKSAASGAGADLSGYSRFVYIFPNISACAWAGYAMIGGSPTDAWINGYFDRRIIAHELGHNLGLHHAHGLNCNTSPIGSSCTTSEYGDPVDTMGWGLYGHFSAFQKESLGWLNGNGMPPITTVQGTGRYALAPYANGTGAAKALKILKGTNPYSGEKTWYYLEYRQPTGFDSGLAGSGNLTGGVAVRIGSPSGGVSLLDMTTNSNTTSDYNDQLDSALTVGRSFTDSTAGVTVTVTRADTTGAAVDVVMGNGGATCTRAKPSVLLSPSQAAAVAAGTSVPYTVVVTNHDSATCGSSAFSLARSLPSGWAGSLAAPTLTVGAGGTASTTLTVTSPLSALAGAYSLGATATSGISSLAGSGWATYSVASAAAGTLSETVATSQGAYVQGNTVYGTATVKLNGSPVANASVAFKLTKSNGDLVHQTAATGANGQAAFQYKLGLADPIGSYRLGATATSGGLSTYTSSSFSVGRAPEPTTGTLTETVVTNQSSYVRGSTVISTATVKNNGVPVADARVTFKLTKSNGDLIYHLTGTDAAGQATFHYLLSSGDPTGYYRSGATATSGGLTAYTSASFKVQ